MRRDSTRTDRGSAPARLAVRCCSAHTHIAGHLEPRRAVAGMNEGYHNRKTATVNIAFPSGEGGPL